MQATAKSHPNIALVKYWGKRDKKLNLPAVGSISITLKKMHTITNIQFNSNLKRDILILNGKEATESQTNRVSQFLDIVRKEAGIITRAKITSDNNFPTGAGLASSASAFASLAMASSAATGINKTEAQLSELARKGSGSAARSIFGGFVEMSLGQQFDGSDSVAHQIATEKYWDIRVLIAITSEEEKKIGSTEGMQHTAKTSPFYKKWLSSSDKDIIDLRTAIQNRDFNRLGEISEFSCLKMHAVALSANPGLIYWNAATINCMHTIRELREYGIPVYFTIDAGPQVKALCLPEQQEEIKSALLKIKGVRQVLVTPLGPGTRLIGE